MFDSVLIANRGEIACRIARTCKRLGIRTVAVYSDADRDALHVEEADHAFPIGAAPPAQSYLRAERIVEAAKETGVDAIHPGYGFLAENADFARRCIQADLVFVGPPVEAIELLGSKSAAIQTMRAAGVPVLDGYHDEAEDDHSLAKAAHALGFPLIIKPRAGGGGRGMRVVARPEALSEAIAGARREAQSAFGDPHLMLERYVEHARHIEVQTFADTHGNVTHLFERDCSAQRRHQKILEEAPAPGIGDALRRRLHEAAVTATSAVAYVGAGTVEFLVDASAEHFFFIEMNTRLQVEHPVTEMLTGTDLVEWQLRVAAGETLPASDTLAPRGHVIEARVYAEQPERGFLPSTGHLDQVSFAPADDTLRVETGVRTGDRVEPFYDPLIAKLIARGRDRAEALGRLRAALATSRVEGVATNIAFLARLAAHPAYVGGGVDTGFVDRFVAELAEASRKADDELLALACLYRVLRRAQTGPRHDRDPFSPWATRTAWRLLGDGTETLEFVYQGSRLDVVVEHRGPRLVVHAGPRPMVVTGHITGDDTLDATIDGSRLAATVASDDLTLAVRTPEKALKLRVYDRFSERLDVAAADEHLRAPLPGTIAAVYARPGDRVQKGQAILAVEAMKMEHLVKAPMSGVLETLHFDVGDRVDEHDELAHILHATPE